MRALLALFLAMAPQPQLSDHDDFNAMVQRQARAIHCDAFRVFKEPHDRLRLVQFRCDTDDTLILFVLRPQGDWIVAEVAPWESPLEPVPSAEDI